MSYRECVIRELRTKNLLFIRKYVLHIRLKIMTGFPGCGLFLICLVLHIFCALGIPFLSFVLVLCAWDPLESFVIISPLRYSESQFVAANHWIKLPLQRSLYLFNVFLWFDNNVVCLSLFLMLNLLSGY